jgi:DNA-directed RNA polymerase specialized sigma24 family protein
MQDIERFLYGYRDIKQQIKERELQIDELVAKKDAIADRLLRTPRLDDVRVQDGTPSDPVCDAVCKMVDVYGQRISRVVDEIKELYAQLDDITRAVERAGLTEQEREYVRLRYFQGLKNVEIARKMNYSQRQILNIKIRCFNQIIV